MPTLAIKSSIRGTKLPRMFQAIPLECLCCFFQVYEEKEKMWERELRKLKGLYDNRLRASQQKSSKMEQALTNQTYQVRERSYEMSKKFSGAVTLTS